MQTSLGEPLGATLNDPELQQRYLALKVVMMPRDTNPHGTIFGGVILSNIDQAGAVGVYQHMRSSGWPDRQIVSVAMDSVEFHKPIFVGDIVSFWTKTLRVGRTSITMHVDVEADRGGKTEHLTEAEVTYVAVEMIDGQRRPIALRGE